MPSAEQNKWVERLFEKILIFIKELELIHESPSIFLVYAHEGKDSADKMADAKVAQRFIKWLNYLGANLYSDKTPGGNNPLGEKDNAFDTKRVENILSSQLCLLPQQSVIPCQRVDRVILCGSRLLGHYLTSDYYQPIYYPGLQKAYQKEQARGTETASPLSVYVNLKARETQAGFHHVLTELGFLEIRASQEDSHGIVPLLLNGTYEESFPRLIAQSTCIRIEDAVYREAGYWSGQITYQNQGLHQAFFKLLRRLWPLQERTIQMIEETVYLGCLNSLQDSSASERQRELAIKQVFDHLQKEGVSRWRSETLETFLKQMEESLVSALGVHLTKPKVELEKRLKEWYPTLIHRLAIQRVSGDTLPMERCYINLAVVEYQSKAALKESMPSSQQTFYRLPSFERVVNTNLKAAIPLEDLFKPRQLKSGNEGIPKRILIRGRAGIGKTTLAKKSLYDYLQQGLWREHFEWLLWIPLRHLKGKKEHYPLETLLREEYFVDCRDGWDLAQALCRKIQTAPSKTLLICDGWDEVAQEKRVACLSELLNHPSVIITSRPHGINVSEIKGLDLELETVGFSEANVMAYLEHQDIVALEVAEAIKGFMKQHPFVRELVNIPIQLDALCYSWDEINDESL